MPEELNLPVLIYEYVTEERRGSGKLYPSSLGGCPRAQLYRVLGQEPTHPMDHRTRWKLKRFGLYEELVKGALRAKLGERALAYQHQIHHPIWSGRTDIEIGGVLVEVKTVSQAAINKPDLPYDHHKAQAHCYACLLEPSPRQVLLFYISRWRDSGHGWRSDELPIMRQFDVTPSAGEIEIVRAQMAELEYWYKKRELPPRAHETPEVHPWECTRDVRDLGRVPACAYFGLCWPAHCDEWGNYLPDGGDDGTGN